MLRCNNGAYYTGSTKNLEKRYKAHSSGRGAKYTARHLPVALVYFEDVLGPLQALAREREIKKLNHAQKEALALEKAKGDIASKKNYQLVGKYP